MLKPSKYIIPFSRGDVKVGDRVLTRVINSYDRTYHQLRKIEGLDEGNNIVYFDGGVRSGNGSIIHIDRRPRWMRLFNLY